MSSREKGSPHQVRILERLCMSFDTDWLAVLLAADERHCVNSVSLKFHDEK